MPADTTSPKTQGLWRSARAFLHDFATISGRKGAIAALYSLGGALLEGVSLPLLVPLVGLVLAAPAVTGRAGQVTSAVFAWFGAETATTRLLILLSMFGALIMARTAVLAVRDVTISDVVRNFIQTQRLQIAERLAVARWDYIAQLRHSRIMHLMSGDVQRLDAGVQHILRGVTGATMLLAQLALAFILSPGLAAVVLVLVIVGAAGIRPRLLQARAVGGYVADANLSLAHSITQFLAGLKVALSQNLELSFVQEVRQTLHQLGERQASFARHQLRSQSLWTALSALLGGGLLLAGFGWFHIAPAVLITFLLLVTRMIAPIAQVSGGAHQLALVLAIYDRVRDLNAELASAARGEEERLAAPGGDGKVSNGLRGKIIFDNVSFWHPDTETRAVGRRNAGGLRNLSLSIAPGEFLGITGQSGVGKTTFADLLVGLYAPQNGRITVGGQPLDGAALPAWRAGLSYVSQDPVLFHDTVRHNLSWANPRAAEETLWDSLALSGADELIRRMDKGLDTVLGERGILVSGGERQRIALARALIRRPHLLVLDEATGAIDTNGEREILARLRSMPHRPTIVLIAHRTENLQLCDRVLRFEAAETAAASRIHLPANTAI